LNIHAKIRDEVNITISDVTGKIWIDKKMASISGSKINVDRLCPDIYFLRLVGDDYNLSQKFIKE